MDLVNRVSGQAGAIQKSIKGISNSLAQASDAAVKNTRAMKELEGAYEKMQKRLEISQRLSFVGMEMTRLGRGMMDPMKRAVITTADFESRMSAVGAVTQATAEEMAALKKHAVELGSTTMFSAKEAAEGMKALGMSGFRTSEILKAMPGLLDMAKAGGEELGAASDIASNILRGFGLEADEMGRVADVLTATFTRSNTTIGSLGETMQYVAPIAKAAGMSLEEASAMAGLLGDAGIKGSMAGTTMRGMLARLASPAGDAADLLSELNVDLLDLDGNLRSPVVVLGELAKAMENMGSGERLAALSTIFDDRAASGMAKLMEDEGVGGITKFLDVLTKSEGSAARVAKQMGDNLTGSFDELSSATEGLQIAFGELLKPMLRLVTGVLTQITAGVAWLTGRSGWLGKTVAVLAAVLAGLALVMGSLLSTLAGLSGSMAATAYFMNVVRIRGLGAALGLDVMKMAAIKLGAGLWKAVVGLWNMAAANWAVLAPVLAVIAAIALLAGAAFLIVKFWGPISGFFVKLWDGIKVGAAKLWSVIKTVFGFSPLGMILNNWEPIAKYFLGLWDKIGGIIEKITAPFRRVGAMFRGATAGAMAGAAVSTAPLPATAGGGITPIERTIAEARVNNSSSMINAPITINAAPGQNPEQVAAAVARELDARDRRGAAQQRARLYD
jgi:TP901 family phage tail tape measure protein